MTKVGLLSDTHGFLDKRIFKHFESCDEVWHAGDIGTQEVASQAGKVQTISSCLWQY